MYTKLRRIRERKIYGFFFLYSAIFITLTTRRNCVILTVGITTRK